MPEDINYHSTFGLLGQKEKANGIGTKIKAKLNLLYFTKAILQIQVGLTVKAVT